MPAAWRWTAVLLLALLGSQASAGTLAVDPATSRVRIHLGRAGLLGFAGHAHEIEAPLAEGAVEVVADDPVRSSVRLRFESGRLSIVPGTEPAGDVAQVEARMRGPEVLDVQRYPEVRFESTSVVVDPAPPGAPARLRVRGRLTLKGRGVEVEIPLLVRRDGAGLVAQGETALELRALGIEPPSVGGVVKVANAFRLSFEVHAR